MNTLGAVKCAVGTGLGIAVIPHLAAREEILRGELVEILKSCPKNAQTSDHIYAIWHDDVPEGLRDAFFDAPLQILILYRRFCIVSWIDSKFGFLNFLEKPTISRF